MSWSRGHRWKTFLTMGRVGSSFSFSNSFVKENVLYFYQLAEMICFFGAILDFFFTNTSPLQLCISLTRQPRMRPVRRKPSLLIYRVHAPCRAESAS